MLAAVKTAKLLGLGPNDALLTVATDGDAMYGSEHQRALARDFGGHCDRTAAATAFERWMLGADTAHTRVLDAAERRRIFNLGYFTWVEQRGVAIEDFVARRDQGFWRGLRDRLPAWNAMIEEFNGRAGTAGAR